MLSSAL
jgi:hypothetical protein